MFRRRQFIKASGASALALHTSVTSAAIPASAVDIGNLKADPNRDAFAFDSVFDITNHGAVGNGSTLNTEAIQAAIDAAGAAPGRSRVVVPQGVFLTGHLRLRSGVELHVSENATVLGSTDIYQYDRTGRNWYALISAEGASGCGISGKGAIDGQGRELALNIKDMHLTGRRPLNSYNERRKRANELDRPQLLEFYRCEKIHIYDVTLMNAAMWVQTHEQCRHLNIDNIRVISDAYWNNDGIDIVDSQDVRITNCFVNSADDAICLKSKTPHLANERVLISNCTVRSSASGVKFGTASKGGFKNIRIENIKVFDTYRSAIALESVDGGVLEDVSVENIKVTNTGNAIFIRLGHRNVNGDVGTLKNVVIRNLRAEIPFERPDYAYELRGPALNAFFNPIPASITGMPGHQVEEIRLEDIEISYPGRANKGLAYIPVNRLDWVPEKKSEYPEFSMFHELPAWALYVRHTNGIRLENIRVTAREDDFRPAFVFDDVENIGMTASRIHANGTHHQIVTRNTRQSRFTSNSLGELAPDKVLKIDE